MAEGGGQRGYSSGSCICKVTQVQVWQDHGLDEDKHPPEYHGGSYSY